MAATPTRIYVVTEDGASPRLVRATYSSTAIRHASFLRFQARVATQADLEKLITAGVRVELANEHPGTQAEPGQLP